MFALRSVGLQINARALLASLSDQPASPSDLPPFCGTLNIDEKLKLSHENFKHLMEEFYKEKHITPISQLSATPPFPTPHVLAQFAYKAYKDYKTRETDAQYEKRLAVPDGWKLLTTASNSNKTNGYFGVAYWHPEHQQVVIAHRGTKPTKSGSLWTDTVGVLFNPLNAELNPICYLLALLAHHFLHVSRIRVKSLTLRLLMSYIYIYGPPILDVSRSHTTTQHSR